MITKKQTLVIGGAAAVLALIGGGTALAATSVRGSAGAQVPYLAGSDPNPPLCVTFGPDGGATGNYVLNNWDHLACPKGTYGLTTPTYYQVKGPVILLGPRATVTSKTVCKSGDTAISGGASAVTPSGINPSAGTITVDSSYPDFPSGWVVTVSNNATSTSADFNVTPYAVCASP